MTDDPGAIELLREVMQWHSDKESSDYCECDKQPCQWCEWASVAITNLELIRAGMDQLTADNARLTKEVEVLKKTLAGRSVSVDERLILGEPIKNAEGNMCGLCDGTYEHAHPTLKCSLCGKEGLSENMIGHECQAAIAREVKQ